MTDYKILGQEAPSADTETDLYTVPGDKSTVVRAINVTNTASASDTFDIANIEGSLVETPTFVAVADQSSEAAISTDGITWTPVTMPSSQSWTNLSSNGTIFVAIAGYYLVKQGGGFGFGANPNAAAYSTDGITWNAGTLPFTNGARSISYGSNTFLVSAFYYVDAAISTNGITWTSTTLPQYGSTFWTVTYGNNIFVAVGQEGVFGSSAAAATSTDGITWTARTLSISRIWWSVTYGNGKFVAVGSGQPISYSTDAITWTTGTLPANGTYVSIEYGNDRFVAVSGMSSTSTISVSSTDGITWTQGTLPSVFTQKVTYGNGLFVTVSAPYNVAATSTDGITWTQRTLPVNAQWQSVGYGNIQSINYPSTSNADYIFKSHEILGNETVTIKGGYTLDSNNKLKIKSTNGTSTFHAFGGEI